MAKQPVEFLPVRPAESAVFGRDSLESAPPPRYIRDEDISARTPVHVVWELTLACNLACSHCGSRAGRRRPRELSTDECYNIVAQLADLGTREISIIGGE